jgi:uncharacterized protein involved in exopolysaccharide biosynthesis
MIPALAHTQPNWRTVGLVTAVGALALTLVVFLLPSEYDASSTFMAVRDQGNALENGLAGLGASIGLNVGAVETPEMTYQELLRSRRVLEKVLAMPLRDPLTGRTGTYEQELRVHGATPAQRSFRAVEAFRKKLSVSMDHKSGLTTVTLSGRHPGMAAAAVNALVAELQTQSLAMHAAVARENLQFVAGEQAAAREALVRAESELTGFRQHNLRVGNAPQLVMEGERLERAVRVREEVYLTLTRQEALARLDENRSTPVISVMDPADPPPFRARPRRGRLLLAGTFAVFVAAVALFRGPVEKRVACR